MQENQLFEYAVIRLVPRVEREEFLNIGVILYCAKQKFLGVIFELNEKKLKYFSPDIDIEEIADHLKTFEKICRGDIDGGAISKLIAAERFRWLTATRSTILQTSKVHPGFTKDAGETLQKLFSQLVV
ncbi:MAG TPA: DUF3037 domain-containing protein [Hanamia sp.]|nr:DUF3037 domain-containing protein [Hanamia sp.]